LIRPLRRRSLSMMRGSMQQGWSHFDVGPHFLSRFPTYYNNTQKVKNEDLFRAPTVHCEDPQPRVSEHLAQEARDCDILVLWLDCDREGEYTCFEVISLARPCLCSTPTLLPDGSGGLPGAWMGNVMRAFFSSLAPADLCHAMHSATPTGTNLEASTHAKSESQSALPYANRGRTVAEGFSPKLRRAHWIGPLT